MKQFYVSSEGRDDWSGMTAQPDSRGNGPLATLNAARDRIRALKQSSEGINEGIEVVLRGGSHTMKQSFILNDNDSGSPGRPIRYRAYPGETPRLLGGGQINAYLTPIRDLDILARIPEAVRERVRQVDLAASGIGNCGTWRTHGFYRRSIAPLELFENGRPMNLARWPKKTPIPNSGYARIQSVADGWVTFETPAPLHWTGEGLQVDGYWKTDWATQASTVKAFDATRTQFRIGEDFKDGMSPTPGKRFFFFNVLEELREPGEYVLDMLRQRVYLLPSVPDSPGELIASALEEPLIQLGNVSHINFEGLYIEAGRGDGIHIADGKDVQIAGCTLRNLGQDGVVLHRGHGHAVVSCDIHHTGMRGVSVGAGDRKTLTPCNHRIHNCHIHHAGRRGKTYVGAISLEHDFVAGEPPSCGVIVTHNRLHNHPHTLLFFWGNDHRIEHNEFYNFTLEGDDCGCLYAGRDFTFQGHRIRNNYFHHGGDSGNAEWGSSGIYLDDGAGGTEISGNLFLWVNRAVQAGGGINTAIERNLFVNCTPAVWFDERCSAARADRGETMVHEYMKGKFAEVDGDGALYQGRYPNLDKVGRALADGTGIKAFGAVIQDNRIFGSKGWLNCAWTEFPYYVTCRNNTVNEPAVACPDPYPPQLITALSPPPIGLVRDAWRQQLEDVWTRIEIDAQPTATGAPGRGRLVISNHGDLPAQGVERIEIRRSRHQAAVTWVEVPFSCAPGEKRECAFDIPIPADYTDETTELYLLSRGEEIRPSWAICPVKCNGRLELETVRRPRVDRSSRQGEVILRLAGASLDEVTVQAEPAAEIVCETEQPAVGAPDTHRLLFMPKPGFCIPRIELSARSKGLAPAQLQLPVEFGIPLLADPLALDQLHENSEGYSRFVVAREFPTTRACTSMADLRLAISDNELLIAGQFFDSAINVTESLWDGSCVEIFAATLDQARLAKVFGNIRIGHLVLVPADREQPARVLRFNEEGSQPVDGAGILSTTLTEGYRLCARIPMESLDLPPGTREFLFEIQVTTGFHPGQPQRRGTCFGSQAAYKDTSRFAMAIIEAEHT